MLANTATTSNNTYLEHNVFNRTFSGTDTLAFILLPGCNPVVLGSITTISYSVLRNKRPVINIGRTNINGVTRGSRIFAGTMVFTLINQHWLREVISQDGIKDWLGEVKDLKVDEMPLFDIMIVSANEYGAWCSMFIYGIDITDEAQTVSIEDLFTENVFQFVARDLSTFSSKQVLAGHDTKNKPTDVVMTESNIRTYVSTESDVDYNRKIREAIKLDNIRIQEEKERAAHVLPRVLYEKTTNPFIGNDVLYVQTNLNRLAIPVNETGVYDENTADAVRLFQLRADIPVNGIMDQRTYNYLLDYNKDDGQERGYIINKYGAQVLDRPSRLANVVATVPYKETVRLYDKIENEEGTYYREKRGYIPEADLFDEDQLHKDLEMPIIKYKDNNAYVRSLKQALKSKFPDAPISSSSMFDKKTSDFVKKLQKQYGLIETGVVDNQTWTMLEEITGEIKTLISQDNFKLAYDLGPNTYDVDINNIYNMIDNINLRYRAQNATDLKCTTIATFDNVRKTVTSYTNTSELTPTQSERDISLTDKKIINAFNYDPKEGGFPSMVELLVYPIGMNACKWIFNLKE